MLADTLCILGYRPEDDSWDTDGRRTYIHDDDATRAWITSMGKVLGRQGWERDTTQLRMWRREDQMIEIEPAGGDCTGHYLHHMKAETV
jgi:hypothetical protein